MFEIDYRDLLRRYVDHVSRCETQGHDFISRRDLVACGVGFSEAEIAVLESMSAGRTAAEIEGAVDVVDVTVPGVLEPGTELVIKNEGDRPMRVVADPHEILKLKTRS
jgi:hypothetical protein